MRKSIGLALGLLLILVPGVWAQIATGNIYGTVTDESGAVLPGATVSISGETIGARSTTTGSQGDFRFLNLNIGIYKLAVGLTGFTNVNREVRIQTGVNVNLSFGLKVATVEETVTVTAETPIVDTKKTGTSTNLTRDELEKIPQARDPWAVLRTIPGVLVDRVNIAGNESGQQAAFASKGTTGASWNLDGVVITDMAALGASPTYYDFDAFDEINVSTGGQDIKAGGGIALNFVTKRGTNTLHGGGRYFLTHDDFQSSNLPAELLSHTLPQGTADNRLKDPDGTFRDKADHIQQVTDYGADLGGPLVKDKLWFYGGYGVQDIRNRRLAGTRDKTKLASYNAKLNWQAGKSDTVSLFYFRGKKIKQGRGVGTGLNEQDTFLWNQDDEKPEGGLRYPGLGKLEWNHIFSPNFFVNSKYAYYGTGFHLFSRGDISEPGVLDFVSGTAKGSSLNYASTRPQHTANVDANYFKTAMGGNHEFKFGFGYRVTPVTSETVYGGRLWGYDYGGGGYALLFRDALYKYKGTFASVYAGDTFTKDRLTLNIGARYDRQKAENQATTVPANPDFPNLLPSVSYDGSGTPIEWNNFSPRIGLTYALDETRKTVVRGSYSRYSGQVASGNVAFYQNPVSVSALLYYWTDSSGDGIPQNGEFSGTDGLPPSLSNVVLPIAIDPSNPSAAVATRQIDSDYTSNIDHEVVVGLDRELLPNLALSAAYTWRRTNNLDWAPVICNSGPCTRADYIALGPVTRTNSQGTFTSQTYRVNPASLRSPRATILTNRDDYYRQFSGAELSLMKRLSNKWMGRVAFSYNDWTEHFTGGVASSKGVSDPTPRRAIPSNGDGGPMVDGGQISLLSGGSGKQQLFSTVKWQMNANALVQLPWDIELAGALFGRQGHPRPAFITFRPSGEGSKQHLAEPTIDGHRYPNLWNLDLRLAKNIRAGNLNMILSAEAFNVLNNDVELTRLVDANSSSYGRLDEVLSPRIVRFGLRFTF